MIAVPFPPTYTWTGIGLLVSGSMAQPPTDTLPRPVETRSTLPNGLVLVTVRQPSNPLGKPGPAGLAFTAHTHTEWVPPAMGTTRSNPWLGPMPGWAAAMSGRATLATNSPALAPSTVTRTVTGF